MIKKYRIGNPIPTGATVKELPIEKGFYERFEVDNQKKAVFTRLSDTAVVYGLGESIRGINKRGWEYVSYCADDPNHEEDKRSLYGAQNFLIIDDKKVKYGVFFDTPGKVTFDIGYTELDKMTVRFEDFDCDVYIVEAATDREIVKEFRGLIGRSYIPPKWALGYGQSRWSYLTASEMETLVDRYHEEGIPIDSVYMDIDYMERYKDFTINEDSFPDFENFVKRMRAKGVHLVPIIDAGVKIEEGYDVYEEGVKNNYFCKKEDGTDLVAAVWPGRVHFPDFLKKETRDWFGGKYKFLIDKGIDGFWNDMNEPAIFYTEDHLKEVFEEIEKYKSMNLDINSFFAFKDIVGSSSNHPDDYKRFYHEYNGQRINHDKVHNLYGYNMTKAAGEAIEKISPDKRILLFSRASYIGMHRYGGVWTGDNKSWWSHILLNIQQMPALNMCGFLYCGADTGGFGADCTKDLMLRWLAVSIFTPLFRNHSASGTRRQELYEFGDTKDAKNIIDLRYALIPYIYSEYLKAAKNNDMYFMPLAFEYEDDEQAREIEDQLLVGESIMIAPVYKQNTTGRTVYLPEDMKLVRFRSINDYDEEVLEKGFHYVKAALNEVPVFIRSGHMLPLCKPAENVEKLDYSTISYISYKADGKEYEMLNDDGITR